MSKSSLLTVVGDTSLISLISDHADPLGDFDRGAGEAGDVTRGVAAVVEQGAAVVYGLGALN